MDWQLEADEILPEYDDEFDPEEMAAAVNAENRRRYAELVDSEPHWLDDVA